MVSILKELIAYMGARKKWWLAPVIITLVVFGEPEAPALLGAYTLEGLRLAADPVSRRLVPVPGLLFLAAGIVRATKPGAET